MVQIKPDINSEFIQNESDIYTFINAQCFMAIYKKLIFCRKPFFYRYPGIIMQNAAKL